jgi:hypothetical protein
MRVMFLSPHAAIWPHAFPEALVAEALTGGGHEVLYVSCGREFASHCTAMSAAGVPWAADARSKSRVCDGCERSERLLRAEFGLAGYSLRSRLTAEDRAGIERHIGQTTQENFLGLVIDGVAVGRYALYELLLNNKKGRLEFSAEEWREYLDALRNALASLFACRRIFDAEAPDRLVAYNTLYSVNRVACMLAERRGIATYFLHAGGNLSHRLETLLIGRSDGVRFYEELLAYWPSVRDKPCSAEALAEVTNHLLELLSGRSFLAYSAAHTADAGRAREVLGIPAGARVLVATMSSPDERFAAATIGVMSEAAAPIFATQLDWIRELSAWVAARPDLFLLIRVHPREFPNKRESVTSEHARSLRDALSQLPANAGVNWPSDNVSLYDLADFASVFLNAWSAAGKEMCLLGLPVVAYAPASLVYPPDLNYIAASKTDYFAKIELALSDGWSADRILAAYRWCALEYEYAAVHIHESFPWARRRPAARMRALLHRVLHRMGKPHWLWWIDCKRRQPMRAGKEIGELLERGLTAPFSLLDGARGNATAEAELRALRTEVSRVARALYRDSRAAGRTTFLRAQLEAFADGAP